MRINLLHGDCMGCLAKRGGEDGEEATMVVLLMLAMGHTLEEMQQNLCFFHRRMHDDHAKAARAGQE